ncbi:MAG: DNA methylase [Blastocatellia bacterium]
MPRAKKASATPSNQWRDRKTKTVRMRVGDVLAHPMNPKLHPDVQNTPLRALLDEVGQVDDLKAYYSARNGGKLTFFDGHARQMLDPNQEWNIDVYDLTDEEADLVVLTFDPIGYQATHDARLVHELMAQVQTSNVALQEFLKAQAAQHVLAHEELPKPGAGGDDFDTTPVEQQTRVRSGDLWQLGTHRLLIGDSTNPTDVVKLMNGERAILFATDPPYLVNYTGLNHPQNRGKDKKNKSKDWRETYHDWDDAKLGDGLFDGFIATAIQHAIVPNAAWYCWHASRKQAELEAVWERHGALVHQQIIWFKTRGVLTYSWYLWAHEPCFFGWVKGQKPERCAEDYPKTVWEIPSSEVENHEHPTSKPIEVFAIPMRQHTLPGELCYEPFCGSGSQIIAAERNARRCFAMEREPNYGEVIVRRWETETGQTATLLERIDETPKPSVPKKTARGKR